MKNTKLELLRAKLAMFTLATSLSVTSLSGCGSNEILSGEEIESCIEETSDFGNHAGLYRKQDGSWGIYYEKDDKYYDFESYEYLSNGLLLASIYQKDSSTDFEDIGLYIVGYLPFDKCNSDVKYTLNVLNNLTESDIEKLKNDFFEKYSFGKSDIELFHIEKIDGTNKQLIIGYPITDTEIFNIETWQLENYEGYAIVKESCEFNNYSVYLSEILDYLNEKRKNIEEVSTIEKETSSVENEEILEEVAMPSSINNISVLEETETINATEPSLEETTAEVETSSVENEEISEEVATPSSINNISVLEETETINATETLLEVEKNVGYEIHSQMANSYVIYIEDNLTSENLTEEEVLDFLVNQKDKIDTIVITNFASDKNKASIEKILKEISENNHITSLMLNYVENLNLSDISTIPQLKNLQLASCTLEDATQLNQVTQLERLYLYDNDINDLNIISNLTQLQDLTIINNGTELANIEILKKFKNLNFLSLRDCNISDISALYDLNHLKYLDLSENPIQNLSELTNMKSTPGIYLTDKANLNDLKSCIEELTEKGISIFCTSNDKSDLITKEYFEQKEELQLKLN